MEKPFVQEVPKIYDGLIQLNLSRDPGSRAKICVKAVDTSLDPVTQEGEVQEFGL